MPENFASALQTKLEEFRNRNARIEQESAQQLAPLFGQAIKQIEEQKYYRQSAERLNEYQKSLFGEDPSIPLNTVESLRTEGIPGATQRIAMLSEQKKIESQGGSLIDESGKNIGTVQASANLEALKQRNDFTTKIAIQFADITGEPEYKEFSDKAKTITPDKMAEFEQTYIPKLVQAQDRKNAIDTMERETAKSNIDISDFDPTKVKTADDVNAFYYAKIKTANAERLALEAQAEFDEEVSSNLAWLSSNPAGMSVVAAMKKTNPEYFDGADIKTSALANNAVMNKIKQATIRYDAQLSGLEDNVKRYSDQGDIYSNLVSDVDNSIIKAFPKNPEYLDIFKRMSTATTTDGIFKPNSFIIVGNKIQEYKTDPRTGISKLETVASGEKGKAIISYYQSNPDYGKNAKLAQISYDKADSTRTDLIVKTEALVTGGEDYNAIIRQVLNSDGTVATSPGTDFTSGGQAQPQKPTTGIPKGFNEWYSNLAKQLNLNPDPFDPRHNFDYVEYFNTYGNTNDEETLKTKHFSSEFKSDTHPRKYLWENGKIMNTVTGDKYKDETELKKAGINLTTEQEKTLEESKTGQPEPAENDLRITTPVEGTQTGNRAAKPEKKIVREETILIGNIDPATISKDTLYKLKKMSSSVKIPVKTVNKGNAAIAEWIKEYNNKHVSNRASAD
jgi:hypothetical protein